MNDDALEDLPLFSLGTVLFPGGILPLRIFEPRYLSMIGACLRQGSPFGICLIREGREVGEPAVPCPVGTLARIVDWDQLPDGLLGISCEGGSRFRIKEYRASAEGLLIASASLIAEDTEAPPEQRHVDLLSALRQITGKPIIDEAGDESKPSASHIGFQLADILPLDPRTRQELLECEDPLRRLDLLHESLGALLYSDKET